MSRYTVATDPEVVGWDDPLGKFWGHVYNDEGDCTVDDFAEMCRRCHRAYDMGRLS